MADTKRKSTRKPPVKKAPAAPAAPQTQELVQPLSRDALRLLLGIIDKSDVKGADAGNIILLKQELARVANVSAQG